MAPKKSSKKRRPKKPVKKAPAAIRKGKKEESAEVTSKPDTVVIDEEISDNSTGNTLDAAKKESGQGSAELLSETSTAPTVTKQSEMKPENSPGEARGTTNEPPPEPVGILNEDNEPLPPVILSEDEVASASLKRKRAIEDKRPESTDLPVPKSPKLDEESSPSSFGKIRELRPLQELALEGWDIQDLCKKICCVDTVDPSRVPSPFADLADREDSFMHIIGHHVHPAVTNLFDNLQLGGIAKLTTWLDERQPGAFGTWQCDGIGPQFFAVPHDPPKLLLKLNRRDRKDGDTHLDVRIRKNSRTGEIGYFVVNVQRNLFINEKLIARHSVTGPLPDFAVIQVGYWVVFWWCTRAALGYIPGSVSQSMKAIENRGAGKGPSNSDSGPTQGFNAALNSIVPLEGGSEEGEIAEPTRTSWEEILANRLRRHKRQRIAAGDTHECHRIVSPSDMNFDDVLLAVATFREPLRDRGTDYAIAGADVVGAAGRLVTFGVVGPGNVFIMPLILPADPEPVERGRTRTVENKADGLNAKGETKKVKFKTDAEDSSSPPGHLLLAVATATMERTHRVNIDIYDSRANTVDSDEIRRKATEVAASWLEERVQTEFSFKSVPQQTGQFNTSGLYVILNAWATMLNIGPIREASSRRSGSEPDANTMENATFVDDVLQIVNLALAGFLDSKTVRAFLHYCGYIDGNVDPREGQSDNENVIRAVTMDQRRFDCALDRAAIRSPDLFSSPSSMNSHNSFGREMLESDPASSSHSDDASGRRDSVQQVKVQHFLDQVPQATFEQADFFVKDAGGDVSDAIMSFVVQKSRVEVSSEGAKPVG